MQTRVFKLHGNNNLHATLHLHPHFCNHYLLQYVALRRQTIRTITVLGMSVLTFTQPLSSDPYLNSRWHTWSYWKLHIMSMVVSGQSLCVMNADNDCGLWLWHVSEGDNRPLASLNEDRCFSGMSFKVRSVKLLMSLNKILKVMSCILDCDCVSLLSICSCRGSLHRALPGYTSFTDRDAMQGRLRQSWNKLGHLLFSRSYSSRWLQLCKLVHSYILHLFFGADASSHTQWFVSIFLSASEASVLRVQYHHKQTWS